MIFEMILMLTKQETGDDTVATRLNLFSEDIKVMEALDHFMNELRINVKFTKIGMDSYFCLSQLYNAIIYGAYTNLDLPINSELMKMYRYNDVNYLSPRMNRKGLPGNVEKVLFSCGTKLTGNSNSNPKDTIKHVERIRFFAYQTYKKKNFLFLFSTIWSLMNASAEVFLKKKEEEEEGEEEGEGEEVGASELEVALMYTSITDHFGKIYKEEKEYSPFKMKKLKKADSGLEKILNGFTMFLLFKIPIDEDIFDTAKENPFVNLIMLLYYDYITKINK